MNILLPNVSNIARVRPISVHVFDCLVHTLLVQCIIVLQDKLPYFLSKKRIWHLKVWLQANVPIWKNIFFVNIVCELYRPMEVLATYRLNMQLLAL